MARLLSLQTQRRAAEDELASLGARLDARARAERHHAEPTAAAAEPTTTTERYGYEYDVTLAAAEEDVLVERKVKYTCIKCGRSAIGAAGGVKSGPWIGARDGRVLSPECEAQRERIRAGADARATHLVEVRGATAVSRRLSNSHSSSEQLFHVFVSQRRSSLHH